MQSTCPSFQTRRATGHGACAQGHDIEVEEVCQGAQQEEHEPAQRVHAAAREPRRHQAHQHRHRRGDRICRRRGRPVAGCQDTNKVV